MAQGAWQPGMATRCGHCGSTSISYAEDGTATCGSCGAVTLPLGKAYETPSAVQPQAVSPAPSASSPPRIQFVNPPPGQRTAPWMVEPTAPYPMPPRTGGTMSAARRNRIVAGAVLLVIGLLVTIGTYAAAASNPSGGTYFIAYGPALIGAYLLITGLANRGVPRGRR